jgi:UDP-N-acetylglucosamine--N-acetylmuramyl-(pentapeptide) pyrophosphoryl-undecaprenol N-acetylglucosamine transferase
MSVEGWQGRIVSVKAKGFQTHGVAGNIMAAIGLAGSVARCRKIMREDLPAVLLAMGSYASVGPVIAARSLGIPVVIHEANAVPGRAVSFLSRFAVCVAVGFKAASGFLRHRNVVFTGFPLRRSLGSGFADSPLDPDVFTILVMGGSQGARRLNEIVSKGFSMLSGKGARFQVIHLSGPADELKIRTIYEQAGIRHMVFGFLKEMGSAYSAADLAISRAGAASCAELAAFGVPAVLVPLPSARRDHQKANAMELKEAGCVEVVDQSDFSPEWLVSCVAAKISDSAGLDKMKDNMKKYAVIDAAERLADVVCSYAVRPEKTGSL